LKVVVVAVATGVVIVGPSIQYRITEKLHIDASCMFGTNSDSDKQIGFLVVGYEFGNASGHSGPIYKPESGRHN